MSKVEGFRLLILKSLEQYINERQELSCSDIFASILQHMGCDRETFVWALGQDDEKVYTAINMSLTTERDNMVTEEEFKQFIQRNT